MNICNDHDQEVCYESRNCPACVIQEKLNSAENEIQELKTKIEELENKE